MLTEYMSVDYVSRFPAVTMESAEPVKYDAMTVSNQLRVLTEGAVYWSAEDIASWTADLLGKYQTQLGRRTLLLDELKDEVCVAGGVLLTASQCDQICKWESELVPASRVAELIDFAKRRVFADPPTPIHRASHPRPGQPAGEIEPSGASSRTRVPVPPGDEAPGSNGRRHTSETEWDANVVRCVLTTDC